MYEQLPKVTVPEGKKNEVEINRFEISEYDSKISMFNYKGRNISTGIYTRLMMNGSVMMSDTPSEMLDHMKVYRKAHDNCIVGGLGIGMIVQGLLLKDGVDKVTVIENSQDVIDLVAPHYQKMFGDRFKVIKADARTWEPEDSEHYDVAWLDIWQDVSVDDLKDMYNLKDKYSEFCNWVDCWGIDMILKHNNKREIPCPACGEYGRFDGNSCYECGYEPY